MTRPRIADETREKTMDESIARTNLANYLRRRNCNWRIEEESRIYCDGDLVGRVDLMATRPGCIDVPVELKWADSRQRACDDARKRLEEQNGDGRFYGALAVTMDEHFGKDAPTFEAALWADELMFGVSVLRTEEDDRSERSGGGEVIVEYPGNGEAILLRPSVLLDLIERMQTPDRLVRRRTSEIAHQIDALSIRMRDAILDMDVGNALLGAIQEKIGKENPADACRTACMSWTIALSKQNDLVGVATGKGAFVQAASQSVQQTSVPTLVSLRHEWETIRDMGYAAAMSPAIVAANALDGYEDKLEGVIGGLEGMIRECHRRDAGRIYTYFGEIWQNLMGQDARKGAAAFYTIPAMAELAATIATARMKGMDLETLRAVSLWDPACGTGGLLSKGERAIQSMCRAKGDDMVTLHRDRMVNCVRGADVDLLTSAITDECLAQLDPNAKMRQGGRRVFVLGEKRGSFEWLDPNKDRVEVRHDTQALSGGRRVEIIGRESMDIIIMNPPYLNPTGGIKMPYSISDLQSKASRKANGGYSGYKRRAGWGAAFFVMANIRLKPGGVLLMVLPATAAQSISWDEFRAELEKDFEDILIISNASSEGGSVSDSTTIGEIIIVATKKAARPAEWSPTSLTLINLQRMPRAVDEAYLLGREIAQTDFGTENGRITHGRWTRVSQEDAGAAWQHTKIGSTDFERIMKEYKKGRLYVPSYGDVIDLPVPMVQLKSLIKPGPSDPTIGYTEDKPRGTYTLHALTPDRDESFTITSLWSTMADLQKSVLVKPTHGGHVWDQNRVKQRRNDPTRWFFNYHLQWTSEAISVAHTAVPCHGGQAFNGFHMRSHVPDGTAELIAWFFTCIFGSIARLALGGSTQNGRSRMSATSFGNILVPDFAANTPGMESARALAKAKFPDLLGKEFMPFAHCYEDPARAWVDRVMAHLLGLNDVEDLDVEDMLERYRWLFANEPGVHGRQKGTQDDLKRAKERRDGLA